MNKLVYSALAMTLVSAPGTASEDWLSLDQEIESLSASLSSQGNGPALSGWIIASYRNSSDIEDFSNFDGDTDNSLGGFTLDSIRLNVAGDVDEYGYMVSYDLMSQEALLQDAYVTMDIGDTVNLRVGQFRQPFLRSGLVDRNRTLFHDRTALGDAFATRDEGVMLSGNFDTLDWYVAAQNGGDLAGEDLRLTGRVSVDLMGDGVGMVEGAYGAGDDTSVTLGLSIADEGAHADGQHFGVDGAITSGPFYGSIEIVSFDDGSDPGPAFGTAWMPLPGAVSGTSPSFLDGREVSDTTPWAATVSYMITPDEYEVAFRYEDSDNDNDETLIRIGINRYVRGHDIKWHLGWSSFETDDSTIDDADMITLGMALTF